MQLQELEDLAHERLEILWDKTILDPITEEKKVLILRQLLK